MSLKFWSITFTETTVPRSMTAQQMSQNLPKRSPGDVLSLRHPNHFVLEGANNRNVIITYRFLAAPVQANRDFFYIDGMTVYFNCKYFPNNERVTRVPRWDFAFWAKSLQGLQMKDGEILHPWKTWIQKFCTALFSAKFTINTTTNEWCKNSAFLKDLDVKIMHGLILR